MYKLIYSADVLHCFSQLVQAEMISKRQRVASVVMSYLMMISAQKALTF